MEDSDSQTPQTKSEDIAEHRAPEPQATPQATPATSQSATEPQEEGPSDAADQGGGRSLRTHKAARSVQAAPPGRSGPAPSTRAVSSGPGRSLRDAVNAAESRARRTFPGRAR